ncbi:endonuclease V [Pedobacter caeni]|uniref:Endonuclease V n=1 Tax=Pedobacter caeni TaxID=288992 RepID=A0A1M5NMV1_9SPHI|nr:endonuclease V [Pedobacter caeni]SHG90914.1 Endonuclease V [Pedobacter caeni]
MILALDSYYPDNAYTICLSFENWNDPAPKEIFTEITPLADEYEPGFFYKRELPCILSMLKKINLENVETIVIDGFVTLDDSGKLGLGGYLHETLNRKIPIIGVAKNDFKSLIHHKRLVYRGTSSKPLYVTAAGMEVEVAAKLIKSMHGDFRIPTLLKELDVLTKKPFSTQ